VAAIELTVEKHFEDKGVWVVVPTQARARPLRIVELDDSDLADMPATPNVFGPDRVVISFQVEEEGNGCPVDGFSPPMVLMVEFAEQDLDLVKQGHELKLAFWDGSRWVVFTKEKHQLEMHSRFAIALIRHWGDPTVGAGR
jgi:hypothetical protein